jgi:hypothetical protein
MQTQKKHTVLCFNDKEYDHMPQHSAGEDPISPFDSP